MRQEVDPGIDAQWARVRARLRSEVGDAAYKSWLKPLTLLSLERGEVRLAVPTRFMRDCVRSHYADRIRALWIGETRQVQAVEVVVQTATAEARSETVVRPEPAPAR